MGGCMRSLFFFWQYFGRFAIFVFYKIRPMKKKILLVFGTRPEAIKMIPVVREFRKAAGEFDAKVCVTAQHRGMLDQVLDFFGITPDYDLNLMKQGQTLTSLTSDVLLGMKPVLEEFNPDWVLVHGDTSTSMAAALAAYYNGSKVAHVEAGLRTYDKWAPFPEEMNRQITGRIADLHFAPTDEAARNLLGERVSIDKIIVTGNTVIDALYESIGKLDEGYSNDEIKMLESMVDPAKETILVTGHRRENFGEGFVNICNALKDIATQRPSAQIIYPVHMNPNVRKPVGEILGDVASVSLIDPLSYPAFVWLMNRSKLIITDSGGVQEEAPSLGKPVLVMRDVTERPEAVKAGTVILVGTDRKKIVREALDLLSNEKRYKKMSGLYNPYGDGMAAKRIVDAFR